MNFGYDWPWTHGHLIVGIVFLALLAVGWRRRWHRGILGLLGVLALWGLTSFWIIHQRFLFNQPVPIPSAKFLASGIGTVLDLGAGSGRSTIGVLRDRPGAQVIAVDLFGKNYGIPDNGADRLLRNVQAAGYAGRVVVQPGDMRQLPFATERFDAAISVAAVDHLSHTDILRTFAEVRRVLKPGGDFLIIVINRDPWMRFVFPFLHGHYFGSRPIRDRWLQRFADSGFRLIEDGRIPGALYLLAQTPL